MDSYIVDNIRERDKIIAYIRDLYYKNKPLVNAMINAYDLEVPFDIISNGYDNHQITAYKKRIVSEYGIQEENAYFAIDKWISLLTTIKKEYWYCIKDGIVRELNDEEIGLVFLICDYVNLGELDFIILNRFDDEIKRRIYEIIDNASDKVKNIYLHKYGLQHNVRLSPKAFRYRYKGIPYDIDDGYIREKGVVAELQRLYVSVLEYLMSVFPEYFVGDKGDLEAGNYLYPIVRDRIANYIYNKVPKGYKKNPQTDIYGFKDGFYIYNCKHKVTEKIFINSISINCKLFEEKISTPQSTDVVGVGKYEELSGLINSFYSEGILTWRDYFKRELQNPKIVCQLLEKGWERTTTNYQGDIEKKEEYISHKEDLFDELIDINLKGVVDQVVIECNGVTLKFICRESSIKRISNWIARDICKSLLEHNDYIPSLMKTMINNESFYRWLLQNDIINLQQLYEAKNNINKYSGYTKYKESIKDVFQRKIVFFKSDVGLEKESLTVENLFKVDLLDKEVNKRLKSILTFYYNEEIKKEKGVWKDS